MCVCLIMTLITYKHASLFFPLVCLFPCIVASACNLTDLGNAAVLLEAYPAQCVLWVTVAFV